MFFIFRIVFEQTNYGTMVVHIVVHPAFFLQVCHVEISIYLAQSSLFLILNSHIKQFRKIINASRSS